MPIVRRLFFLPFFCFCFFQVGGLHAPTCPPLLSMQPSPPSMQRGCATTATVCRLSFLFFSFLFFSFLFFSFLFFSFFCFFFPFLFFFFFFLSFLFSLSFFVLPSFVFLHS